MSDAEKNLIAGGLAGSVGKTLTAPLSRITLLLQVGAVGSDVANSRGLESVLRTCRSIYREEGIRAFWKGNMTSIIHRFPYSAINFSTFEIFRDAMCQGDISETPLIRLVCGGLSGAVACVCCYPLDLIKTRLAVDKYGHYKGIVDAIRSVIKHEGVVGLYRGLSTALVVCVPTLAISYSSFGTLKSYIVRRKQKYLHCEKTGQLNVAGGLLCGSASGVVSSLLMFPVDLVRRRLQVQGFGQMHGPGGGPTQQPMGAGAFAVCRDILRTSGLKGLYRGIVPEMIKVKCIHRACAESIDKQLAFNMYRSHLWLALPSAPLNSVQIYFTQNPDYRDVSS